MNIFAICSDPIDAAVLPDKLAVKMPLETAQMLSTVCRRYGINVTGLYKSAYAKHPCTLWAGETQGNFEWLVYHGLALCDQYTQRYGKIHKSQAVIELCAAFIEVVPPGDRTPFAQCMPDEFKGPDAHVAYRKFMTSKPYWPGYGKSIEMPQYAEWV